MVIRNVGSRIEAKVYGRGAVTARGTATDETFSLRGRRMAVSYRIDGVYAGDTLKGTIRVLSVHRDFTGRRRAGERQGSNR
jgi:hypothetical protein